MTFKESVRVGEWVGGDFYVDRRIPHTRMTGDI